MPSEADNRLLLKLSVMVLPSGLQEARMAPVAERVLDMCASHSEPQPHVFQCISAAASLAAKRVILADASGRRLRMRLSLNVPVDDARQALQSGDDADWMAKLKLS